MTSVILLALFCSASARGEAFLDVFGGAGITLPADISVGRSGGQVRFEAVPVSTKSFKLPVHYLIRAGWYFPAGNEHGASVGFSVALLHLKQFYEGAQISEAFENFSITHGYNHLPLELSARLPLWRSDRFQAGRCAPYVSGGPSVLLLHPEVQWRGAEPQSPGYQFGGIGLNASVGVRFLISSFMGVGAEYRFTASRGSFALAGDQYSVTELTHHLLFGVTVSSAVF